VEDSDNDHLSDDTLNAIMDRTLELLSIKDQQEKVKLQIDTLEKSKKKLWREFYSLKSRGEELQLKVTRARKKRKTSN
jgi:chaperonin cofactor prefoldin